MVNDLSPQTHLELDKLFTESMSPAGLTVESHGANLLSIVTNLSGGRYADIWPINDKMLTLEECENLLRSRPDIRSLLQTAHAERKYAKIRSLRMSTRRASVQVFAYSSLAEFHEGSILSRRFIAGERYVFFLEVVGGLTYSCRRNLTKDRMALKPITLIHA